MLELTEWLRRNQAAATGWGSGAASKVLAGEFELQLLVRKTRIDKLEMAANNAAMISSWLVPECLGLGC